MKDAYLKAIGEKLTEIGNLIAAAQGSVGDTPSLDQLREVVKHYRFIHFNNEDDDCCDGCHHEVRARDRLIAALEAEVKRLRDSHREPLTTEETSTLIDEWAQPGRPCGEVVRAVIAKFLELRKVKP